VGSYAADKKSLQRDIQRLRSMGQQFEFDSKRGGYFEAESSNPAFTLPLTEGEIDVIRQLPEAYQYTPYGDAARSLRDKLVKMLPEAERAKTQRRPFIQITIPALDELSQHLATAHVIQRAYNEQRDVQFDYQRPAQTNTVNIRAQVTRQLNLREGHIYFEVFVFKDDMEYQCRLSHVVLGSARLLPTKRPTRTVHTRMLHIRYWLASNLEPSRRFANHVAERQPDGSHVISADVPHVEAGFAVLTLLRYGQYCRVLEPPELVEEMIQAARGMAEAYGLL
jgi:predicted DNA-binding transcriptional regulator YafY